eukprot:UN06261
MSDMSDSNLANVQIIAADTISFIDGTGSFSDLYVYSSTGIAVNHNLESTVGSIVLTYQSAPLIIQPDVNITSNDALTLKGN